MRKPIIMALTCTLALFGLVGCGQASPELEGTWVLDSIEAEHDGVAMTAEEVDIFERALGSSTTLKLKSNGNAELDNFGELMTGTWEQVDETTGTLTITDYGEAVNTELENGGTLPEDEKIEGVALVVEGQNLIIELDGEKYVFVTEEANAEQAA